MNTLTFGAHTVDVAALVATVLAVVVIASIARQLLRHTHSAKHATTWRLIVLAVAQPICAALLYLALFPPTLPGEAGTLVVATAGASASRASAGKGDAFVALPEAPALTDVERVPDLATALRRHPGMQRLRVLGAGLVARDRDAARGHAVVFEPDALPPGLVILDAPTQAVAGGDFRVHGRAQDLRGGVAELLDPGRQRVDRVALPDDGRFALDATTRVPGAAVFTLRLRDARQRIVDDIALPMQVDAPTPPRVLLLAGAPGPEIKYLRRWARDAGVAMQAQMAVGGGVELGDTPIAVNAANLQRFDLVILDERAWSGLGESQRAALTEAIRGGLGMLLRVTAALSEPERRRLRALGFTVDEGRDATEVQLSNATRDDDALRARIGPGTRDQARTHDAPVPETPVLTQRTLRMTADDGVPLLRDQQDQTLALWRAEGRGRVAVWPLTDTYRLVLAGRDDLHAETWSDALATLARAQNGARFTIDGETRVGERVAICGIAREASVTSPRGATVTALVDPNTGARNCAAFWPREAGWHRVTSAGRAQLFHARATDDAPGLHTSLVREATLQLAADAPTYDAATSASLPVPRHPGARWPWWLAWLLASGALWWFERSRRGVRSPDASAPSSRTR
ncbi:hypothetical protein LVB87_11330 [Lysobacter sp. KIS68-7]|uniref:hypothetical protein n=1 Tax=Lysobacter sp. KIS68-7 TaxID=2904252 RepID=UPI001E65A8CE|nr:hypothetical protein [Lysobacter sp. KIS68-7]UHQ18773.1 hypothetical protein LVB87_11330 [Lysobacter sp. KIS68-7]